MCRKNADGTRSVPTTICSSYFFAVLARPTERRKGVISSGNIVHPKQGVSPEDVRIGAAVLGVVTCPMQDSSEASGRKAALNWLRFCFKHTDIEPNIHQNLE